MIALVRSPSPQIGRCELTHLERVPIDADRVRRQHASYCETLVRLGCRVVELEPRPDLPDGVFVEDTAVVLPEVAVLTRPGAVSRRPEVASVAGVLRDYRITACIESGTLDGGDVLCAGRSIYVGLSTRTDEVAVDAFRGIVQPFGYEVFTVPVRDCLHLKSAATYAGRNTILLNPDRVSPDVFDGHEVVAVDAAEPDGANVVSLGNTVLCSASYPLTSARLSARGFEVEAVESDEIAKAEGALTCCSLLIAST